jgi:hypothetical protein
MIHLNIQVRIKKMIVVVLLEGFLYLRLPTRSPISISITKYGLQISAENYWKHTFSLFCAPLKQWWSIYVWESKRQMRIMVLSLATSQFEHISWQFTHLLQHLLIKWAHHLMGCSEIWLLSEYIYIL